MDKKELEKRTMKFAHDCIKIGALLPENILGRHIKGQLFRCATSVPANYRAANLAQSKPAFVSKLSIVIEEADECSFWLEFVRDEKLLSIEQTTPLIKEAIEICSIFISSRKSIQSQIINHK